MTNVIQPSYSYPMATQAADTAASTATSVSTGPTAKPTTRQAETDEGVESVTLSAAAQANTALVGAARSAKGVDQAHVNAIKQALANGTYNVSPEDLAGAISSVLSETRE